MSADESLYSEMYNGLLQQGITGELAHWLVQLARSVNTLADRVEELDA